MNWCWVEEEIDKFHAHMGGKRGGGGHLNGQSLVGNILAHSNVSSSSRYLTVWKACEISGTCKEGVINHS